MDRGRQGCSGLRAVLQRCVIRFDTDHLQRLRRPDEVGRPEHRHRCTTYDNDGNPAQRTDANGKVVESRYDGLTAS